MKKNNIIKSVFFSPYGWNETHNFFLKTASFKDGNKKDYINLNIKIWKKQFEDKGLTLEKLEKFYPHEGYYYIVEGSLDFYNGRMNINITNEPTNEKAIIRMETKPNIAKEPEIFGNHRIDNVEDGDNKLNDNAASNIEEAEQDIKEVEQVELNRPPLNEEDINLEDLEF